MRDKVASPSLRELDTPVDTPDDHHESCQDRCGRDVAERFLAPQLREGAEADNAQQDGEEERADELRDDADGHGGGAGLC